jgi:hypothetical protein
MMPAPRRIDPFASMDLDLDLSGIAPASPAQVRPKPDKAATRAAAERMGFTSREPASSPAIAAPAQPDPAPPRAQRRHTTGRNRQLNLKVTEDALSRFYTLAERHKLVLGEAFAQAVTALEEKLR